LPNQDQHTDLSDEALLLQYRKSNDTKWLGYLLQRYTILLFGVAYKYLKDKYKAEDAVQQIFLKVLTNIPAEEIRNFKGWLYVLMRNHCLQQMKDKGRIQELGEHEAVLQDGESLENIYEVEYNLEQMEEAMKLLNVEQRLSIELFYLKKRSYEQIITETGYSFMQVKSYIQNGKRNLRNILTEKMSTKRNG